MVKNSSNSSNGGGNSSSPPKVKKKQVSPSRHWCFTLNNYTKQDIIRLQNIDSSIVPRYVFQEETGVAGEVEDNEGTPHLQGYIDFGKDKKRRPLKMFKVLLGHGRIHWGKTRDVKASIRYCQKDYTRTGDTFRRGIESPYKLDLKLFEWEKKLKEKLEEEPDDRTIHWLWEQNGCAGKTTFSKWVFMNMERVVVLSGKASDMKNGIIAYKETNGYLPRIVLINIPRSTNTEYVSWAGIEEIKDMFFFSGKYEGGMVCGRNPHVVIFSNDEPPIHKVSKDRWKVFKVPKIGLANP